MSPTPSRRSRLLPTFKTFLAHPGLLGLALVIISASVLLIRGQQSGMVIALIVVATILILVVVLGLEFRTYREGRADEQNP